MKAFPIISVEDLQIRYDAVCHLFAGDRTKILEAAQRATHGQVGAFVISAAPVENQITIIKNKIKRIDNRTGQNLLLTIFEELDNDLLANNNVAIGVTRDIFLELLRFPFNNGSKISYTSDKEWVWTWDIVVQGYDLKVSINLRKCDNQIQDIVPDYVLQYISQSINAFNEDRNAASLALMSIALEGTLRDALHSKGYTYTYGAPNQDVYELKDINIYPDANGFKVMFPDVMPLHHNGYLATPGAASHETFRIKRITKGQDSFLEIRNVSSILDYWSSSTVVMPAQMNISGLGTAIQIARNTASFLSDMDLPSDTDDVIQAIRNNLIHLSGIALTTQVSLNSGTITLGEFIKDKNKVSDTIISISDAINNIYNRLSTNTL